MFSFHNTPEKFENGVFTLKTHQMFSVHTTQEKFEMAAITGNFGCVLQKNSGKEIMITVTSTMKHEAGGFKFVQFEESF